MSKCKKQKFVDPQILGSHQHVVCRSLPKTSWNYLSLQPCSKHHLGPSYSQMYGYQSVWWWHQVWICDRTPCRHFQVFLFANPLNFHAAHVVVTSWPHRPPKSSQLQDVSNARDQQGKTSICHSQTCPWKALASMHSPWSTAPVVQLGMRGP